MPRAGADYDSASRHSAVLSSSVVGCDCTRSLMPNMPTKRAAASINSEIAPVSRGMVNPSRLPEDRDNRAAVNRVGSALKQIGIGHPGDAISLIAVTG